MRELSVIDLLGTFSAWHVLGQFGICCCLAFEAVDSFLSISALLVGI
jgi:hypothetical protein